MAFRVQDPVSGLFWEVDGGYRIRLAEKGSVYTHDDSSAIVNTETGMPLRIAGNKVVEGDWPAKWRIVDGTISMDDEHIIQYDESSECLRVASTPASWVLVPAGAEPVVVVPEPVAEPVTEPEADSETESDEEVPALVTDDEEDDDVPVARGAALIEEALNAQAAAADEDKEDE